MRLKAMVAAAPLSRLETKFAGAPYWPRGAEYPTDERRVPMTLLAQLNFDKLPSLEGYPQAGMLQFFISGGANDLYGADFDRPREQSNFRVIYHATLVAEEDLAELPHAGFPDDIAPLSKEHSIEAELAEDIVNTQDYRFDRLVDAAGLSRPLTDEVFEALDDALPWGGCRVGGYASFTQDDPRDPETFQYAGGGREQKGPWVLLFQMDSEAEIMWGDCGIANWFIREADLTALDFSDVWYNWDCS